MNSSLINAMNSMQAYQQKIDIISDNVANMNTVGYKKKDTAFEDLLTTTKQQPSGFELEGRLSPLGFNQGWGSRIGSITLDLSQGSLNQTNLPTDLAIEGRALFEVQTDDAGTRAYTRDGSFQIAVTANNEAILTTDQGYPVIATLPDGTEGRIVIPEGYQMHVAQDGTIHGVNGNQNIVLGRIKLVEVVRPDALTTISENLYAISEGINADNVVQQVIPTSDNGFAVLQGYLESSNVDLTTEMTDLVKMQRAYQLAARALTSSDTMMGLANNMRS